MDPDAGPPLERHRIPLLAWVVALASVGLALAAMLAVPGPAMEGCLHAKGCYPVPKPPALAAASVLVLGAIVSIVIGRIPRHWVIGWSVTLAGMSAAVLATIPLSIEAFGFRVIRLPSAGLDRFERVFMVGTGSLLAFLVLSVLLVAVGMLVASLLPAHRALPLPDTIDSDPRPRWQRELESVRAAISGSSRPLSSSESQLVAELAYQVHNGSLSVPSRLGAIGSQLLDLLSRDGAQTRAHVLAVIERAMTHGDDRLRPYRSC